MKKLYLIALSTLSILGAFAQTQILEFNPGSDDIVFQHAVFGDQLIFTATSEGNGFEPWISDGTPEGTVQLADIDPGSGSSTPFFYTPLGDVCIFRAFHPSYGIEYWVTDGTETGTQILVDSEPGAISGVSSETITVLGDFAYFAASSPGYGEELWRTDGTPGGTERITDINDDQMSANIEWMVAAETKLFFVANDNWTNHELYVHAPAFGATYEVDDINGSNNESSFNDFWPVCMEHFQGDEVMFAADNGSDGKELWISNSFGGGTYQVKDINPNGDSNPCYFHKHNGLMYFFADDGTHGVELWVSDGTEAGTNMVIDATTGVNIDPWITDFGDNMIFKTSGTGQGSELWLTDGTLEGTSLIDQIDGIQISHPQDDFEGLFFFGANKLGNGIEVFATDGTTEGTGLFADVYPGFQHGQPHDWLEWDNKLWFLSNDGDGQNLYYITQAEAQGFCSLANDECSGAETLVVNGVETQVKSFSCAMDEADLLCGDAIGPSLWFEFVAPASGIVDYAISPFGQAPSDFNPAVSIVEGSCGALTEIQCMDNNPIGEAEEGSVNGLTDGASYFLVLHDPAGGKGLYSITLTEGEVCLGDYTLDGVVDSEDLLDFLVYYGCFSGCAGDLNGDDQVLGEDLLIFLAAFGTTCP